MISSGVRKRVMLAIRSLIMHYIAGVECKSILPPLSASLSPRTADCIDRVTLYQSHFSFTNLVDREGVPMTQDRTYFNKYLGPVSKLDVTKPAEPRVSFVCR